jgi:hypothetical protein
LRTGYSLLPLLSSDDRSLFVLVFMKIGDKVVFCSN